MAIRDEYAESEGERDIREAYQALTPEEQKKYDRRFAWSIGIFCIIPVALIGTAVLIWGPQALTWNPF